MIMLTVLSVSCDRDKNEDPSVPGVVQPSLQMLAGNLTAPVTLVDAPDDKDLLYVVDQVGKIHILDQSTIAPQPFLDITSRIVPLNSSYDERGLLGLAFHPDYANNRKFYVFYSAPVRPGAPNDFDHTSVIAEYTASDGEVGDPSSERIILQVDQPQANHNGGTIAFGPDNYLYISIGDGGNRDDEGNGHVEDWYKDNAGGNGQDVKQNLLGNILRIDVNGGSPYAIPADNPFVGTPGKDEIYAYGFRNPYRFSFDQQTGMLLVSDAGQELWEEVSVVTKGHNYGWNVKEGRHCFDAENPNNPPATCPSVDSIGNPLIDPVIEFPNSKNNEGVGVVVVGGYVYRGSNVAELNGTYIFGAWSRSFDRPQGVILASPVQGPSDIWGYSPLSLQNAENGNLNDYLLGFGQDSKGEVYVLTSNTTGPTGNTGKVYKISAQ